MTENPRNAPDSEPRESLAKYTAQIVFFVDRAMDHDLRAAVDSLRIKRAEVLRRVIDLIGPVLVEEHLAREVYVYGTETDEPTDHQVVFNLEPSQMELIDLLVTKRKVRGRTGSSRGTVLREMISRGLPALLAHVRAAGGDTARRAELIETLRQANGPEVTVSGHGT